MSRGKMKSARLERAGHLVLLLLLAFLTATGAEAQSSGAPASEGALFLLLPVGAEGVSSGRAMSAKSSQEAAFWNPAGLAEINRGRFLMYRGETLAGEATAISMLFTPESWGTFGLSYQLLDVGTQDLTDSEGMTLGSITIRSHLGILSFAAPITRRVSTGVNFKLVQFRVDCRGQCDNPGIAASTYAVDLGLQATPIDRIPLRLGAMIAHLGPKLQVVNAEQADPLPTRMRVSASYNVLEHFLENEDFEFWTTVELEDRWRDPGSPSTYFGTEFSSGTADVVYVRAGYVVGRIDQPDGAAVGMGIRYERLELAVAKSLARPGLGGESEPIHVTLGILF